MPNIASSAAKASSAPIRTITSSTSRAGARHSFPTASTLRASVPVAGDRARFGLPEDRPVVLMVSALIASKRVLEGIEAVARTEDLALGGRRRRPDALRGARRRRTPARQSLLAIHRARRRHAGPLPLRRHLPSSLARRILRQCVRRGARLRPAGRCGSIAARLMDRRRAWLSRRHVAPRRPSRRDCARLWRGPRRAKSVASHRPSNFPGTSSRANISISSTRLSQPVRAYDPGGSRPEDLATTEVCGRAEARSDDPCLSRQLLSGRLAYLHPPRDRISSTARLEIATFSIRRPPAAELVGDADRRVA